VTLTHLVLTGPTVFLQNYLQCLENCYQLLTLEQVVLTPTHGPNILDLCFSNHPDSVISVVCIPGISDREAVLIKFRSQMCFSKLSSKAVHLYNRANWDEI